MNAVLGIDLGTTYFKAGLFSENGALLALGRMAVDAEIGAAGRFEIPAPRFRDLLRGVIGQALRESGLAAGAIQAVSYSSQANSFLLLDGDARPLSPVILWQDRRVGEIPAELAGLLARDDFLAVTGLDLIGPLGCAAKLLWLQDHDTRAWRGTRAIMTVSDYLAYLMTGERAGDSGTASLLGTWNLPDGQWWPEALEALHIEPSMLSRQFAPGTVIGRTSREAAELFGLPQGVPFAVGGLDHHMAAVGSGVGNVASVLESTGTVLACFAESARFSPRPKCAAGPGVAGAAPFYSLAFHDSGAVVLEWYRKRYAERFSFDDLAALAETVAVGSEGLFCLPLADTYPGKDGFRAVGPEHGHGHFVRAIMESIAAELSLLLARLCGDALPGRLLSSGGASRSDLWLRIKADVTGCTLVTTGFPEAACACAAMLAAYAAGWFSTPIAASTAWVRAQKTIAPDPVTRARYQDWLAQFLRVRP